MLILSWEYPQSTWNFLIWQPLTAHTWTIFLFLCLATSCCHLTKCYCVNAQWTYILYDFLCNISGWFCQLVVIWRKLTRSFFLQWNCLFIKRLYYQRIFSLMFLKCISWEGFHFAFVLFLLIILHFIYEVLSQDLIGLSN